MIIYYVVTLDNREEFEIHSEDFESAAKAAIHIQRYDYPDRYIISVKEKYVYL